MKQLAIAIYCVNYHSYDSLHNYLRSIEKAAGKAGKAEEVSVIVADNTIPAEPLTYNPTQFSLKVFTTGNNLGYFGAVEYAFKQVQPADFDYIIISNVDVLMTEDSIVELTKTNLNTSIGWIAPRLYSTTHQFDWNPQAISRYPKKKLRIMQFLFKHPFLLFLKQRIFHQYRHITSYPAGADIYAAHGSFILLTKHFFERCGGIHYPVFLYFEEIYLAEECRKHQLKVVYMPQIEISDIGSVSTGKMPAKTYCKYNHEGVSFILSHYY